MLWDERHLVSARPNCRHTVPEAVRPKNVNVTKWAHKANKGLVFKNNTTVMCCIQSAGLWVVGVTPVILGCLPQAKWKQLDCGPDAPLTKRLVCENTTSRMGYSTWLWWQGVYQVWEVQAPRGVFVFSLVSATYLPAQLLSQYLYLTANSDGPNRTYTKLLLLKSTAKSFSISSNVLK